MNTVQEFLHMGGYAAYVWSAYALGAVVLIGSVLAPLLRERVILRRLANRSTRDDA